VSASATTRRVTLWLALAYVVSLALIAFWPTPVDRSLQGSLSAVIAWLHRIGAPPWLNYAVVEFSSNVVLFIPIGLLVGAFAGRRRWWLGIVVGFFTSCCIELGQLLFLPERYATINDVIANTLGAVIGALVALMALRAKSRPRD
jgi:glycopeptide antibiotics resistance protein